MNQPRRTLFVLTLPVVAVALLVTAVFLIRPDADRVGTPKASEARRTALRPLEVIRQETESTTSTSPAKTLSEFPPLPVQILRFGSPASTPTAAPAAPLLPGAPESLRIWESDVLLHRDGAYLYPAAMYSATLDRGRVLVERPVEFAEIGTPKLAYQFETLQSGASVIARNSAAAPAARGEDRIVEYEHTGGVTERYRLDRDRLEQDFVVSELADRNADLRVTGTVSTNLTPPVDGSRGAMLRFTHEGQEVLTLSEAVAVDAQGRRLPLEMAYDGGRVSIVVPAWWVSGASLPLTIDPVVGTPLVVANPIQSISKTDVAYNSTQKTYLAVWDTWVSSTVGYGIFGQVIDSAGNKVNSALSLGVTSSINNTQPAVSYAAAVDRWLVAWSFLPAGAGAGNLSNLAGAVVSGTGGVFKAAFTIDSRPFQYLPPSIAFDGTNWHVSYAAYAQNGATGPGTFNGYFVSSAGVPVKAADIVTTGTAALYNFSSAFANGKYYFLWRVGFSPSSSVLARTMDTAGTVSPTVTTLGTSSSTIFYGKISPGAANSLLAVYSDNTMYGVATDGALAVQKSFVISSGTWVNAAYSATSAEWLVVAISGGSVSGSLVVPTGTVGGDSIGGSPNGVQLPSVTWNSSNNEMLVVYSMFPAPGSIQQIMAARYQFPPPPTPPAPTGLTATAGNSQVLLSWASSAGATKYQVLRSRTNGGPYNDSVGFTTSTSFTDPGVENNYTYYYVVKALNLNGESGQSNQASATPRAPTSVSALLIVGNTTLGAGDLAIQTRLQNQGYTVVVKGDTASLASDANGKALVVISSTVTSGNVNTKFRTVAVPVLNDEPSLMNPMGMTGSISPTNFGTITGQTQVSMVAANASHPMAAGKTGLVTVLGAANTFTYGQPNANAQVIAALPSDSTRAVIFVYEKGAVMPGLTAPARRAGFFVNDTTASNLNANGNALFDAAVRYCAGSPPAPSVVNAQSTAAGVSLTWEPADGALAYNIYRSTSPPTPGHLGSLIGPGVSLTYFLDATAVIGTTYYYTVIATNAGGFSSLITASVLQANGNTLVGVLGPAYIRRLPPPPDGLYLTGNYQAFVKYTDSAGTVTNLGNNARNYNTSLTPMWAWAPGGNPNLIAGLTWSLWTMTLSSTQNTGDGNIAMQFQPNQTTFPGSPIGRTNFTVKSRTKVTLLVWLKFPGNDPGRTKRTWTDSKGVVKNPFEMANGQLTANAQEARGGIAGQVQGWLQKYWGQGLIDFYVEANQVVPTDPSMQLTGFNGGLFDDGTANTPSQHLTKLQNDDKFHTQGAINLWLVQGLKSGFSGVALQGETTAVVADATDGNIAFTASHEMGHCLGLDDAENLPALDGILNNLTAYEGDAAARTRLLMKHAGWQLTPNGGWLTKGEVEPARIIATSQNPKYEAFFQLEPK